MARVILKQLTKVFPGNVKAVDNVDLTVADGEFLSLVGPSGCGKTTILRMVAGLETPTRGTIGFNHQDVTNIPVQARNVGLVFQNYAVFPTMNVFENVAYGLRVRRLPEQQIRAKVLHHLELVGLAGLAHRAPAHLSGGQLQRVALARALVIEPTLLLLDEPLSNLDAKLRVSIRGEIKKIQQRLGITTIYVTHDQEEALSISDRVGVIQQGNLEQVAAPVELYNKPATRFVATFIGEGTMLDGRATASPSGGAAAPSRDTASPSGGTTLQLGDHRVALPQHAGDPPSGPVWVCIRPEAVILSGNDSAEETTGPDMPHTLDGVIEHLEFLGPSLRGDIRVPGLPTLLAFSCPAPKTRKRLRIGEHVRLHLDAECICWGPSPRPGTMETITP